MSSEDNLSPNILPLQMRQLPDVYREKARKELNETPENMTKGLKELKEMVREHEVTSEIDFVDDFLIQFLRHRKYDVNRALRQLVNFIHFRTKYSQFFLSIENMHRKSPHFFTVLPRCPDGCTIMLFEMGKWDPEEWTFDEIQQVMVMVYTQWLRDPMTQINGFKIIYDFTHISIRKHGRYLTPKNLYLLYHCALDCYPCRYKEIHLVSDTFGTRLAWTIVQPFLSQKMKRRIFVHTVPETLLDYFPSSVLPAQYGGDLVGYTTNEWTREASEQHRGFSLGGQNNFY